MERVVSVMLWVPPVVQVAGCLALALAGGKLGLAIQARQRGPGPAELLIGLLLAAMHVGYALAPLWWGTGRKWWSLGLMAPMALLVVGAVCAVLGRQLQDGTPEQRRLAIIAILIALALYGLPVLIVLGAPRRAA